MRQDSRSFFSNQFDFMQASFSIFNRE